MQVQYIWFPFKMFRPKSIVWNYCSIFMWWKTFAQFCILCLNVGDMSLLSLSALIKWEQCYSLYACTTFFIYGSINCMSFQGAYKCPGTYYFTLEQLKNLVPMCNDHLSENPTCLHKHEYWEKRILKIVKLCMLP